MGDYIQVGDQRGVVKEIGLRCTIINTDDGITVLIPNGAFISANIVNWTFPNPRTRLHVPLTVARQANIGEVTQILSEVAGEHPLLVKNPGPTVEMRGVGAAGIMLELLAWSDKPERLPTIVGELTLAADRRLREKGLLP